MRLPATLNSSDNSCCFALASLMNVPLSRARVVEGGAVAGFLVLAALPFLLRNRIAREEEIGGDE